MPGRPLLGVDCSDTIRLLEERKSLLEDMIVEIDDRINELQAERERTERQLRDLSEGIGIAMRLEDIMDKIPEGSQPYRGKKLQEAVLKAFQIHGSQSLTGAKIRDLLLTGGFDRTSYSDKSFSAAVNNAMKRLAKSGKLISTPSIRGGYKAAIGGTQMLL